MRAREREVRYRVKIALNLLVYSLDGHKDHGWAMVKARNRELHQVSQVGGRNSTPAAFPGAL